MLVLLACSMLSWSAMAQESQVDKAQLAAANELFLAMQLEKTFSNSIEMMMDLQIRQNPKIAPFRKVMMDFFSKYMSWDSLKDDMAKIYMAEFTTQELKELTAFYKTPVGVKAALKMPQLMNKGGELGMKRVQEHMTELQKMIADEAKRLEEEKNANKADPAEAK